jgi:hypothetical protein
MKRSLFIILFILSIVSSAFSASYEGYTDANGVFHGAGYIGKQITTPTAPSAGHDYLYPKSDNKWYTQSPAGVEVLVGPPSGTGITSLNALTGATQTFANDTNVTMTSAGTTHTVGWAGTLAAARLNSNVVQSIVNDTNIAGTIAAQALTLGWTGSLSVGRGGTGRITSTTAYGLLAAGTTATGAHQTLATVGTDTQYLRGNTGALPTWQTKAPIDSRDYATIELADAAAYAAGKQLLIAQNHTLTANTVIASAIKIIKGGSFTKASTYTLTINGPFDAGLYQVFSGFTTGVTFSGGLVKELLPEWWGANAVPGTTDMTVPLQAALTCAYASRSESGYGGSTTSMTTPLVKWGPTRYKITTQLTVPYFVSIEADQTSLEAADTVDMLTFSGRSTVKGVIFRGGKDVITIANANTGSSAMVLVKSCNFYQWSGTAIISSGATSTQASVDDCVFLNVIQATKVSDTLLQLLTFRNCLVQVRSAVVWHNDGFLILENVIGVPDDPAGSPAGDTVLTWIENYGNLIVNNTRFGNEFDGAIVLKNYATTTPDGLNVSITNSGCYGTSKYTVIFYAIPNFRLLQV